MDASNFHLSRREVLVVAAAAAGAAAVPLRPARAAAQYTRPNVTSLAGQKMLRIYARGVEEMLKKPADHPHNWFRNAFVHMMDCPHGNWWFYVWHRGYIGYFEQTIRAVTGEASFVLPYWDWTQLPQIPDGMFDDFLTPTSAPFAPYTGNLARFTKFMKPALTEYWANLSADQLAQLEKRGYKSIDDVWSDILGYTLIKCDPPKDPPDIVPIAGNQAFVITGGARYLSRDNPDLDGKTAANVDLRIILGGLSPKEFNIADAPHSFTSSKTSSHHVPPPDSTVFSTLEGFPHNKVHNYIGGYGSIETSDPQPGPFGNMTNNLSPIDPVFFLHHANMDRLWDVWTRKQQAMGLPHRPADADRETFFSEPFLFFVDGKGDPVVAGKAEDFFDMAVFEYDYEPGSGEQIIPQTVAAAPAEAQPTIRGSVAANVATVAVPQALVQSHLAASRAQPLVAAVTLTRPTGPSAPREFDVLVNAPEGVTRVSADSPYYAGTFALFGAPMPDMHGHGGTDLTFAVPLPQTLQAFTALAAGADATLNIRVVPSHGEDQEAPVLKAVSLATP